MKEFFSIDEAAAWLSKRSEDNFSRDDLLRDNEKGRAPIYFDYKGYLGTFSDYSGPNSWLFPKPTQRTYFNGILKSLSPCEHGVEVTCSRILKKIISGVSRNCIESKTTKSNILRPHKVESFGTLNSDPDIHTFNTSGTFWGRVRESDGYLDSTSAIPESEWLFHISDLRVIAGLPQAVALSLDTNAVDGPVNEPAFPSDAVSVIQVSSARAVASAAPRVSSPKKVAKGAQHKISNRPQPVLHAEIDCAKGKALNPLDPTSVWAELVKMAENKIGCLVGSDENTVKYQFGEVVKNFKKRSLNERMKRAETY